MAKSKFREIKYGYGKYFYKKVKGNYIYLNFIPKKGEL